jgi:uncharacterized protein YggE
MPITKRSSAVVALLIIAVFLLSAQVTAPQDASVIMTQGIGTVRLQADQAWLSVAVEGRANKAVEARTRAATQMTALQTAIRAAGIPAEAIKTASFSMQPQMEMEYGAKVRVREYAVRNQIEVRVDSVDLLSEVLDAAGSVKTSDTVAVSVTGLRFDVKNRAAAEQDAVRAAVQDAMSRAQAIAAAAGQSVGRIVRVEEQRVTVAEQPRPLNPVIRRDMSMANALAGGGGRGSSAALPGGQASAVDTPIDANQIEFRSLVTLAAAIR